MFAYRDDGHSCIRRRASGYGRAVPLPRLLLALATVPFVLGFAACGGSDTKKVLFPGGCAKPSYKPTQIIVTCGDANTVVQQITWKSYGEKSANGSGTAAVNDCDPNCAAGHALKSPATVVLSKPKDCGNGVTQFTSLVMTYTGAKPRSAGSQISEEFPCNGP
jgi:hypothetical protein